MALHQCPSCGKASFEKVAESGEWWWMCHECDYEEDIDEEGQLDFDPDAIGDEVDDEDDDCYGWGYEETFDFDEEK